MPDKHELTITIRNNKEVVAASKGGAEKRGRLALSDLRRATLRVFEDWLADDRIRRDRETKVLGTHLYEAIFNGEIPDLLSDKIKEAKEANQRLRLQLSVEKEVGELIGLPWEFLYSPKRQNFLATDVNLVLSRYIPLGVEREALDPQESPLNILVAVSRPKDEAAVISKEVVAAIKNLEEDHPVTVNRIDQPTIDDLEDALSKYKPHVFHFIGHGDFDQQDKVGKIALIKADSQDADWCTDQNLVQLFKDTEVFPRLVFLHMCDAGKSDSIKFSLQAFSGFAPNLIHARIPSIVAMQYPIKNGDARRFSLAFYGELAKGETVDTAVQEGRRRLDRNRQTRLFGTPVLYMHSSDGIIIRKTQNKGEANNPVSGQENGTPTPAPMVQKDSDTFVTGKSTDSGLTISASDMSPTRKIIIAGLTTIGNMGLEEGDRFLLRRWVLKYEKELANKTAAQMGNLLFQRYQEEQNPLQKNILWDMMNEVTV